MIKEQVTQLFHFYALFSGVGDTKFVNQSPDYIIEKWNRIVGTIPPATKYPNLKLSQLYNEWKNKWGKSTELVPDSLLIYIIETQHNTNVEKNVIEEVVEKYQNYIGYITQIKVDRSPGVHELLIQIVDDLVKLMLTPDLIREIKLRELLS
jgi:hypothetical protein